MTRLSPAAGSFVQVVAGFAWSSKSPLIHLYAPDRGLIPCSVKLEHAFAVSIYVRHQRCEQEEEDPEQPDGAGVGLWVQTCEGLGPRVEEDHFDIKDEEDHCDEVKTDVEAFAGGIDRGHA